MQYKLIAIDMDGTLLTDGKQITARNKEAVRKASEKGVVCCLCTGRPFYGIGKYLGALGLTTPVITNNGALIVDPVTGQALFERELELEFARRLWELSAQLDTTVCIWSKDELYVNRINDRTDSYKRISGAEPSVVADFEHLAERGITKMLWNDRPERIAEFRSLLDAELAGRINYMTSIDCFLELTSRKVSKGAAMEWLGGTLGIKREEMIAVGDGENDLSMLRYAGLGVAMDNAADEIKAVSGYVTLTNNESGVAHVIEKFILGC